MRLRRLFRVTKGGAIRPYLLVNLTRELHARPHICGRDENVSIKIFQIPADIARADLFFV